MFEMKGLYRKNIYLLIAIPVLFISVMWKFLSERSLFPKYEAKKLYNIFQSKEKQIDNYIASTIFKITNLKDTSNIWVTQNPEIYDEGTYVCVIQNNSLIFTYLYYMKLLTFLQSHKCGNYCHSYL